MEFTKRDCGCIYLANGLGTIGMLVYYCGCDHFEDPYNLGKIERLPNGVYTPLPEEGGEAVRRQLNSLIADGYRFKEIRNLLGLKENDNA